MDVSDHRKTFGVSGRYCAEVRREQGLPRGAAIDWSAVSPGRIWRLAEEQFSAAGTPDSVIDDYFSQWNSYIGGK